MTIPLPELFVPLTQAIENVLELWSVSNSVPHDRYVRVGTSCIPSIPSLGL